MNADQNTNKEEKPNDRPVSENERNKESPSKLKWALIGSLLVAIAALVTKIYITIFYYNEKYLPNYFLNYRMNFGDKAMLKTFFKKIPLNSFSATKHPEKQYVYEMGQQDGKEQLLSSVSWPLHAPRGIPDYASFFYDNKRFLAFNEDFLRFRKYIYDQLFTKNQEKPTGELISDKSEGIKTKPLVVDDSIDNYETIVQSAMVKYPIILAYSAAIINAYEYIHTSAFKMTGLTVESIKSSQIVKYVQKIVDSTGVNYKVTPTDIYNYTKRMGAVQSSVFDSFLYSQAYYVFMFATMNVDLKGFAKPIKSVQNITDKARSAQYEKEMSLYSSERPFHIARIFSKTFIPIFGTDLKTGDGGINFIERKMGKGTSIKYSDESKKGWNEVTKFDDENMGILWDDFKKKVEPLESKVG